MNPQVFFVPHPPILIPEIGKGEQQKAAKTLSGFEVLNESVTKDTYDVLLCITPHGPMFSDVICIMRYDYVNGLTQFGMRDASARAQHTKIMDEISDALNAAQIPVIDLDAAQAKKYGVQPRYDHGAAVPLHLLPALQGVPLVCISPGFLPRHLLYEAGRRIAKVLEPYRSLILASGDLSHAHEGAPYPYSPDSTRYDRVVCEALRTGQRNLLIDMPEDLVQSASQCAINPFIMAFGALDHCGARFELHSYEAPYGVGYATASAEPGSTDALVQFARDAVDFHVRLRGKASAKPESHEPKLLNKRAGVFVTLYQYGELRGCIGTLAPTQPNISEEILYCAQQAALHDPRFLPVEVSELPTLDIKVDVLHEMEPIQGPEELDPKRYGVVVSSGYMRGLLLPNLDGVDTVEQQIGIARQKAGIAPGMPITLERFEVERHEIL